MRDLQPKLLSTAQRRYVLGSLFLTGSCTLVLEIVGTRVISPYYGSSLYCWSALISVTLLALAAGYNLGGLWADRAMSLTLFARLNCLAGLLAALIPSLRVAVLKATSPLGIQLGAVASALVLVAPVLVCLSALGPLAVRLTTPALATLGKSTGNAYALSTLGSVAGAVLAGFVLIPHLGVQRILYGLACLLLLLGCLGYYLSQAKAPLLKLAAAAAVGLIGFWPRREPETNLLLNKDSYYGQIKVLDFNRRRYLLVDGTTQSMAMSDTLESDSQYAQCLEWAALLRGHGPRATESPALVIGIGGGLLAGVLENKYGIRTDAVDIDPEIVAAAKTYFGYAPRGEVAIADGRAYLERTPRRYGLIFLDAFGAEAPPTHLFTAESFQAMRRRLEPDGIVGINLVTLVEGRGSQAWLGAYKTLQSVFPRVRAYLASDTYDGLGNVLFFCSDAAFPEDAALKAARPAIRRNLASMLARELKPEPEALARAPLMQDDYAPMEFLLAETAWRWRDGLQKRVASILLY